jgi:hypothetical protein
MIKINYKQPESTESKDEIAKYNIKICDQFKKADYLELSCISWLKNDSKRNYQNLEDLFRFENLESHVIAQLVSNIPPGLKINLPNKVETEQNKLVWVAKITCMNKKDSINELLKHHISYEDNYECLKDTGCFMSIKKDTLEEEEKILQTKNADEVKKLLNCELKLDFELFKPSDSINYIIQDAINKYGKEPEKIICGEIGTNKVLALMIDGQIISPIGWIEKKKELDNVNNIEIECELVDFRKIKIERA